MRSTFPLNAQATYQPRSLSHLVKIRKQAAAEPQAMPPVTIVTHTTVLVVLVLASAGVLPEKGIGHGWRPVSGKWSKLPGDLRKGLEAGMEQFTSGLGLLLVDKSLVEWTLQIDHLLSTYTNLVELAHIPFSLFSFVTVL